MLQNQSEDSTHANAAPIPPQLKTAGPENTIKVAGTSKTTAVAGAIAGIIRQHRYAEAQAIGAAAVNQTIKAVAVAVTYLKQDDINIICIPYFAQVIIEDQEYTALRFLIEPREDSPHPNQ